MKYSQTFFVRFNVSLKRVLVLLDWNSFCSSELGFTWLKFPELELFFNQHHTKFHANRNSYTLKYNPWFCHMEYANLKPNNILMWHDISYLNDTKGMLNVWCQSGSVMMYAAKEPNKLVGLPYLIEWDFSWISCVKHDACVQPRPGSNSPQESTTCSIVGLELRTDFITRGLITVLWWRKIGNLWAKVLA